MDPLSIAATSAALKESCYELISLTDSLIHDKVPDSDLTISGLGVVLQSTSVVLDEVSDTWRSHSASLMMHPSASFGMWPNVQNTLERFEIIFRMLKGKLEPVVKVDRSRSFAKAWKLGRHLNRISRCRCYLESNNKALKLGANMMIMCIRLETKTLPKDGQSSLTVLDTETEKLEAAIQTTRKLSTISVSSKIDIEKYGLIASMENLAKSAKSFYSFIATAPLAATTQGDGESSAPPPSYAQAVKPDSEETGAE
ncbi:hypothetical protein BJX99DRAFT_103558 [Aspergillus californicus]